MPTLRVLQGAGLINCAVLIVRYFGGTKLGGGGLARAYSGAAQDAINNADLVPFQKILSKTVRADFASGSELERRVETLGLTVMTRDYTEDGVTLTVEGPKRFWQSYKVSKSGSSFQLFRMRLIAPPQIADSRLRHPMARPWDPCRFLTKQPCAVRPKSRLGLPDQVRQ